MIMILNLGIGLITPPVGPTLFVGCAIGKVTMEQVSKELWPFYGAMCARAAARHLHSGDFAVAAWADEMKMPNQSTRAPENFTTF